METNLILKSDEQNFIKTELKKIQDKYSKLTIADQSSYETATTIALDTNNLLKRIKEFRDAKVKPIKVEIENFDNKIKIFSNPLTAIINDLKLKMSSYLRKRQEEARAAEEKARQKAEVKNEKAIDRFGEKKAEALGKITDIETIKVTPEIANKTVTMKGSATGKKIWKFEIEDLKKVPREYLIISEPLINKAIRSGIREIPGVKIYEDTTIALY